MKEQFFLFSGSSNHDLSESVSKTLNVNLGRMNLNQFPDGEIRVQILEQVRNVDVFIIQSIAKNPQDYFMELLIIIDALKRLSPKSITAIIPYLGYCRQDRRDKPGMPITAKLIANMLRVAGITDLITFDLHSEQIEGFFDIPVNHLRCQTLLSQNVKKFILEPFVILSPDIGSVRIGERVANLLKMKFAIVKKERLNFQETKGVLIGDILNQNVLIVDDLCSTANTLIEAANLCKQHGAKKVFAAITHGLFSQNAIQKIEKSCLEHLFVTDTIPQDEEPSFIKVVSIAPMIAEAILRRN